MKNENLNIISSVFLFLCSLSPVFSQSKGLKSITENELRTHLELEEAEQCMAGKQCVSLGLQVAELRAQMDRPSD